MTETEKSVLIGQDTREKTEKIAKMPQMLWPTNYNRYAAATMFTLFFAGNTFAPDFTIEGVPAQDFLQAHYIAAMRHCYRRLKNCAAIIGWGTMNEPHFGFIGYKNIAALENYVLALGTMPTPFQAMTAASGYPTAFPIYKTTLFGEKIVGKQTFGNQSLFREGFFCPWKLSGVWTDADGSPKLLKPNHFAAHNGKQVSFADDFLKPFMQKFAESMRIGAETLPIFIEGLPNGTHPHWSNTDAPNMVNAFHWYDGLTLFTKTFRSWFNVNLATRKPIFGAKNIADSFTNTLTESVAWTRREMNNMPCLLGEFGVPFDLNGRKSFKTNDYSAHETALSMYYDAIDANLLSATIWNYTPDNTNAYGDRWNGEDLSIFSEGRARGMRGWLRPFPMATAGEPIFFRWDKKRGALAFRYKANPSIAEPSELFFPTFWLGENPKIVVNTPATFDFFPESNRLFVYNNDFNGEITVTAHASR